MVTAKQDPQYQRQASRLGIEQFFTKPLDTGVLAGAIVERLAAPAAGALAHA